MGDEFEVEIRWVPAKDTLSLQIERPERNSYHSLLPCCWLESNAAFRFTILSQSSLCLACVFSRRPFGIQLSNNLLHHNEYNKTSCSYCTLPSDLASCSLGCSTFPSLSLFVFAFDFLVFLVQTGAINALPHLFNKKILAYLIIYPVSNCKSSFITSLSIGSYLCLCIYLTHKHKRGPEPVTSGIHTLYGSLVASGCPHFHPGAVSWSFQSHESSSTNRNNILTWPWLWLGLHLAL